MTGKLQIPPEFESAPTDERIAFVQDLWDKIASEPERVPVLEEHVRIVEERLQQSPSDPKTTPLWSDALANLLARFRDR